MASEQAAQSSPGNMRASCQKRLIRLVSTLHGIADFIKNWTIRKNVPPASHRSVALNYFRTGLRILFTTFLETKTQLWELM